ncbi:MAG: Smr/MutS family protein [Alphaproteobacteria bacterium]
MSDKKTKNPFGDTEIWEHITKNVKPLKTKGRKSLAALSYHQPKNEKPWETSAMAPLPLHAFGNLHSGKARFLNEELGLGDLTQMDGRNAERLRKGRLNFDGRLDLHGFTAEQAWHALKSFILFSHKNNRRCVIVITGKGWRNETGIGVLRSNMSKWLNAPEIRPYILGFSRAQDKDGGDGAFYVMLKKYKKR